jgi:hypothetical protein
MGYLIPAAVQMMTGHHSNVPSGEGLQQRRGLGLNLAEPRELIRWFLHPAVACESVNLPNGACDEWVCAGRTTGRGGVTMF